MLILFSSAAETSQLSKLLYLNKYTYVSKKFHLSHRDTAHTVKEKFGKKLYDALLK